MSVRRCAEELLRPKSAAFLARQIGDREALGDEIGMSAAET